MALVQYLVGFYLFEQIKIHITKCYLAKDAME